MLRSAAQAMLALPVASTSGAAVAMLAPGSIGAMRSVFRAYGSEAKPAVVEVTKDADFKELVKDHKGLAIVDFTAKWCGPCKVIAPVYEQLAKENPQVKFTKVDIDNPDVLTTVASHQVSGVPMFVFYKGGKQVASFTGAQRDKLMLYLNQHK